MKQKPQKGRVRAFEVDVPKTQAVKCELLKSCELTLREQHTLGQETGGKRAWGGFAVAVVK